jgi:hypothetical protein
MDVQPPPFTRSANLTGALDADSSLASWNTDSTYHPDSSFALISLERSRGEASPDEVGPGFEREVSKELPHVHRTVRS